MTFSNPVAIDFGYGSLDGISDALGDRTCIVVTTPGMESRGCFERLLAYCGERIVAIHSDVLPNPTLDSASNAAAELRHISADVIVVMGGGSAIDTAKAIAAQRHPELEASWLREYLDSDDGGGRDFPENFTPPPIIAIPTTAGTGSEVTMWSTLWDPVLRHKHSLAHPALYPERAIIDPELTLTQPIALTVNSALDALSHALEAIWNHSANPVSDALAIRVLGTLPTALREVLRRPNDMGARGPLQHASVLAGLASSGTRTAIAHSMSYPLTLSLGMPHGLACSFALPEILRVNGEAYPERGRLIGEALGARSLTAAVQGLYRLLEDAQVPEALRRYAPGVRHITRLEGELLHPGRAENNLVKVSCEGARGLLVRSYRNLLRTPPRSRVAFREQGPDNGNSNRRGATT